MTRGFTSCAIALGALAVGFAGAGAGAATLTPDAVAVSTSGSNDTTDPFTDDVLLESTTFGTTTYDYATGSFSAAGRFEVLTGRSQINAEWGDTDDGSDGDGTPFAKAGHPNADQETTDPAVQDAALLEAFASRSLSEITDGENRGKEHSFKTSFTKSLAFDDVGGDDLPDLVFFERGGNDEFDIELITGGTFANPLYSTAVTIDSGSFAEAGFSINTTEIRNAQKMFVGGFDLDHFGLGSGDSAFGFRLTTTDGPDLGGFFLAAEDPADFGDPIAAVPLPASLWLLVSALGLGAGVLRRRRAA